MTQSSRSIPQLLCIPATREYFPNGWIKYWQQDGHIYIYSKADTDKDPNGNWCYRLASIRFGRKKRRSTGPPCACTATLIAEPAVLTEGTPLTLTYTTSPCADSASIARTPGDGTINAPPPGGVIVLNFGDPGYPVTGGNTYTLTVVTNTGECTATADIFVII